MTLAWGFNKRLSGFVMLSVLMDLPCRDENVVPLILQNTTNGSVSY